MSTEASLVTRYKSYCDYDNPHPIGKALTTNRFRYWEIAVAVPVPNNHFSYFAKIRKLLYAATSAVSTTIYLECTSNAEALKVKECVDLTVGNSNTGGFAKLTSADGSLSKIIELSRTTAPSVAGSVLTLYLEVAVGEIFAEDAVFVFYTPKLAEGWDIESQYVLTNVPLVKPYGLKKLLPSDLDNTSGKVNAQMLSINGNLVDDAYTNVLFRTNLQDDIHRFINTNYVYRMGMRYTLQWASIAGTSQQFVLSLYNALLAANTFTVKNSIIDYTNSEYIAGKYFLINSPPINGSSFTTIANIRSTASYRKIGIVINPAVDPTTDEFHYIGLEDFWFEHSGGVETYNANTSLGCLLLPTPPDRDSIDKGYDADEIDFIRTDNNKRFAYNPYGSPNQTRKHYVKCSFKDIPFAQYQKLKILEGFQSDGYLLNLHPHFIEMPEVLTGYMRITNNKPTGFDFSRMSFDFEFQEA